MKKQLAFLFALVFAFLGVEAQTTSGTYSTENLYGRTVNRIDPLYHLGLPSDTFPVPIKKRNRPHMAFKGRLYIWSPQLLKWDTAAGGGGISSALVWKKGDTVFNLNPPIVAFKGQNGQRDTLAIDPNSLSVWNQARTLSITGDQLSILGGNSVTLPSGGGGSVTLAGVNGSFQYKYGNSLTATRLHYDSSNGRLTFGNKMYLEPFAGLGYWMNFPDDGAWGIGFGGAGNSPAIAYTHTAGQWFTSAESGDINIRSQYAGVSIGNGNGIPALNIRGNIPRFSGEMYLGLLTADPPATNGAHYYNTTLNKFRAFEGGVWKDMIGGTGGDTGPAGPTGPTGATGYSPVVSVASTTTGAAGTSASVVDTDAGPDVSLAFTIPKGADGTGGGGGSTITASDYQVVTKQPTTGFVGNDNLIWVDPWKSLQISGASGGNPALKISRATTYGVNFLEMVDQLSSTTYGQPDRGFSFGNAASSGFYPTINFNPTNDWNSAFILSNTTDAGSRAAMFFDGRKITGPLVNQDVVGFGSYSNTYVAVGANQNLRINIRAGSGDRYAGYNSIGELIEMPAPESGGGYTGADAVKITGNQYEIAGDKTFSGNIGIGLNGAEPDYDLDIAGIFRNRNSRFTGVGGVYGAGAGKRLGYFTSAGELFNLPNGTEGQVLKTVGADVVWADDATGGDSPANGSITEEMLATPVQTKLNAESTLDPTQFNGNGAGTPFGIIKDATPTTNSTKPVESGGVATALAGKQNTISLTTTGTSGAATFDGSTLNIPQYSGGGTQSNNFTGTVNVSEGDVVFSTTGFGPVVVSPDGNQWRLTVNNAGTVIATSLAGAPQNLLFWSQQLDNQAKWFPGGNMVVTPNQATAPDGTVTADEISVAGASDNPVYQIVAVSPSTQYTYSFWAKRGTLTDPRYSVRDATNSTDLVTTNYYNLNGMNATTWTRHSYTFTTASNTTSLIIYANRNSVGTGTSLLWQMQLNVGATPRPNTLTEDTRVL